jgi:hypothetical protein
LPPGWGFGGANVRNGWSKFTLNDVVTPEGLVVRLTAACDIAGAIEKPSDQPGTRRNEQTEPGRSRLATTWYLVFEGGCATAQFRSASDVDPTLASQASTAIGFATRPVLQHALDQRSNG